MSGIYWWTGAIIFWLAALIGAGVLAWLVIEQIVALLTWWAKSRSPYYRTLFTAWVLRHGRHRKTKEQVIGTLKWLIEELESPTDAGIEAK